MGAIDLRLTCVLHVFVLLIRWQWRDGAPSSIHACLQIEYEGGESRAGCASLQRKEIAAGFDGWRYAGGVSSPRKGLLQAEAGHVRVDEWIALLSGMSSLVNAGCAARHCS